MWIFRLIGVLVFIAILFMILDWIGWFFSKIANKIKEFFDDGRTITDEQRMKELKARRNFEKKHPGTKC